MSYDPYNDEENAPQFMDENFVNLGDCPIWDMLDDDGEPITIQCANKIKTAYPQIDLYSEKKRL